MDAWVVGSGGLLGSALVRNPAPGDRFFDAPRVGWDSAAGSLARLRLSLEEFHAWRAPGRAWGIVWAAGSGVIASAPERLRSETAVVTQFAEAVAAAGAGVGAGDPGAFLLASSASIFGSGSQVFDERWEPRPLNAYGCTKLDQETAVASALRGVVPFAVARISTLYGPGQNLGKGQGLISSMCADALQRRAISIYVPLDTTRDYLYADDAAIQCRALLARTAASRAIGPTGDPTEPLLRVVASHRTTTIGELARLVQSVARRRPQMLQVHTATSALHSRHLALTSIDPAMREFPVTPLTVGLHAVYQGLLRAQMVARPVRVADATLAAE